MVIPSGRWAGSAGLGLGRAAHNDCLGGENRSCMIWCMILLLIL